jgi:phosphate-selective porin OprO/OprP
MRSPATGKGEEVMLRRIGVLGLSLAASFLSLAGVVAPAAAAEKTVVEEILDILKEKEHISEAQYQSLKSRAQEEAAQLAQPPAQAAAPPPAPDPRTFRAFWKDGPRLETADKAFQFRMLGRLQNDWAVLEPDDDLQDDPDIDDRAGKGSGTEFRRARMGFAGTLYERFGFKAEYDFADGETSLKDTYVEVMKLPWVQNLRIGHFKEPMSLDELTSDSYTTFMERALPNALVPSRNTGFMLFGGALEQRMTWALGAFRNTDNQSGNGFSDDPLYNVTGRVTGLPWYEEDGRRLLHLGLSASQQFRDQQNVAFRQRPEAHLAPNFVQTGNLAAHGVQIVNPELAVVYGPFSFQSEYVQTFVNGAGDVGDPDFWGVYAQASWFLTGESRPYKVSEGIFDRVAPRRNFDLDGGRGAWELALRFSRLDLDEGDVDGGTLDTGTFGVNWYLNPNLRWTLNYVLGRLEDVGWTNQFETRFQIDF